MQEALRTWTCRNCGRSNKTVIERNGSVKCEYCNYVMSIQPARSRGEETPAQLSRFSRRTP